MLTGYGRILGDGRWEMGYGGDHIEMATLKDEFDSSLSISMYERYSYQ
jgi:hypothetical protein